LNRVTVAYNTLCIQPDIYLYDESSEVDYRTQLCCTEDLQTSTFFTVHQKICDKVRTFDIRISLEFVSNVEPIIYLLIFKKCINQLYVHRPNNTKRVIVSQMIIDPF